MNWIPLVISLVGGAGGGAAVGKFLKEKGLAPVASIIIGAVGGAGGAALLQAMGLGGGSGSAGGSGTDMGSMLGGLLGGGAGGGVLTAIVGLIKSSMGSKS